MYLTIIRVLWLCYDHSIQGNAKFITNFGYRWHRLTEILWIYSDTICWVTVIISMTISALPTHLWGEATGAWWFSQNSVMWSFFACFVVSLNNLLTNSRVVHGWRRHDGNVISLDWLLVIFKMLDILDKWNHPCAWQVDLFVRTSGCCQPKVILDQ